IRKSCREKRVTQIAGNLNSDDSAAHAEDVHVVVLDALVSRVVILHQTRPDARNFVSAHGRTDSATADGDAALDFALCDGLREGDDEIGIVVAGSDGVRAQVEHLVARVTKIRGQLLFQLEATVIGGDSYSHCYEPRLLLLPALWRMRLTGPTNEPADASSASTRACSFRTRP